MRGLSFLLPTAESAALCCGPGRRTSDNPRWPFAIIVPSL